MSASFSPPSEVLYSIFEYFDHPLDLCNMELVSKEFRTVARDYPLWRNLLIRWFPKCGGEFAMKPKLKFKFEYEKKLRRDIQKAYQNIPGNIRIQFVVPISYYRQHQVIQTLLETQILANFSRKLADYGMTNGNRSYNIYFTDQCHFFPNRECQLFIDDPVDIWKLTIEFIQKDMKPNESQQSENHGQSSFLEGNTDSHSTPSTPPPTNRLDIENEIAKQLGLINFSCENDRILEMIQEKSIQNSIQTKLAFSIVHMDDSNVLMRFHESYPDIIYASETWVTREHDSFFDFFEDTASIQIFMKAIQNLKQKQQKADHLRDTVCSMCNISHFNTDSVTLDQQINFFEEMLRLDENIVERIASSCIDSIKIVDRKYLDESFNTTLDETILPFDFSIDDLQQLFCSEYHYQPNHGTIEDIIPSQIIPRKQVSYVIVEYHSIQKMTNPALLFAKKREIKKSIAEVQKNANPHIDEEKLKKLQQDFFSIQRELNMKRPFVIHLTDQIE